MNNKHRNQRGVALILAMFALIVVTSIALGMMYLADTETSVDSNFRDTQLSYYAARAGLEEARDRMRAGSTNAIASLPAVAPGAVGGVLYILNPKNGETVAPWTATNAYVDDEICKEVTCGTGATLPPTAGWYVNPALTAGSAYVATPVQPYKWMRITRKLNQSAAGTSTTMYVDASSTHPAYFACWNGTNEVLSTTSTCASSNKPIYLITTLAVTPSGSRRMLQYEVTQDSITLNIPGALTIDGSIPAGAASICGSGSTCNGSGAYITGAEPAGCTGPTMPAIATADSTSNANLVTAINANKTNIVGAGGTPSVQSAATSLASLNTPTEIEALVSQMKSLAGTNIGSDCTKLNLGTAASPTITVVTNDPISSGVSGGVGCTLSSGTTGYGILVLTGDLQYVNVNSYQGVILMLGTANFVSSSSKDTILTGALFMAQDRNPSTGALLSTLGTPGFNYHHGNASSADPSIQFNQCLINSVSTAADYKTVASHELLY
jgi:hypothetical protein